MDSTELARVARRARVRYELARLRRALLGVAPLLVVVAAVASVTRRPSSALGFGLGTAFASLAMLWYGRDPQRAVLPGVAAGLVPLGLALYANHLHNCGTGSCASLCVPACTLGGALAGFAVASLGNHRRSGLWYWASASSLALLTGAMGCACVGYSGVVGLAFGFGFGVAPGALWRAFGRQGA